jgi:hypothetical protein
MKGRAVKEPSIFVVIGGVGILCILALITVVLGVFALFLDIASSLMPCKNCKKKLSASM